MNRPNDNTTSRLTALQEKYARHLPDKLSALARAIGKVKIDSSDSSSVAEAILLAHRLRGTAGTHGFPAVGVAAQQIEESLQTIPRAPAGESKHVWRRINAAMSDARAALASSTKRGSPIYSTEVVLERAKLLTVTQDTEFVEHAQSVGHKQLFTIIHAHSCSEALEKARHMCFDAVLIDIFDGADDAPFQLARELRNVPGNESLPLGFISGSAGMDLRISAAQSGGSIFIEKPIEATTLGAALQQIVAARRVRQPRILVVDDDEEFLAYVSSILWDEGMTVHTLADGAQLPDMIDQVKPDLLLLDVNMPSVSGLDVCQMLRSSSRWQSLPIIFLTAYNDLESRLAAFRAGCDDYLPKPVIPEELLTRITIRLERAQLIRDRADKDSLTGLLLRRAFLEGLSGMTSEARRHDGRFSICLIDVDHFKQINDFHGHLTGDAVLSTLGKLLERRFRTEDLRGRWGGEEFILAFRDQAKGTVLGAIERVLDEFRTLRFSDEHEDEFSATFSAGLATFPDDGNSIHALLEVSDKRLYRAKEQGRNRVIALP